MRAESPLQPSRGKGSPVRVLDLFSGAGGLSLGWGWAMQGRSVDAVGAVDSDGSLGAVFAWNHENVPFLCHTFGNALERDEARQIARKLDLAPTEIDILLASPPCQAFSAAGKRAQHPDQHLVLHVCSVAALLKPRVILIENVPQFATAFEGRLAGRVRVLLARAGYITTSRVLSALDFGVPQTRVRSFTLAIRSDTFAGRGAELTERWQITLRAASIRKSPTIVKHSIPEGIVSVRDAIDDLPALVAGAGEPEALLASEATSAYQLLLRDGYGRLFNHIAPRHSLSMIEAMANVNPGETPQRNLDHPLRRKDYFRGAYARLHPDEPAPTITTQTQNPGSGRFTHYRDDRVLTVREVARIQSFPDTFRFFGSQETQRRHIGNAVPPLWAKAIATSILCIVDL